MQRINDVLAEVHFIRWIAIYPLGNVIYSLNNRSQDDKQGVNKKKMLASRQTCGFKSESYNYIVLHVD